MSENPQPLNWETVQAVWDAGGETLRERPAEERTEVGKETNHTKYIVCSAIGVRCGPFPVFEPVLRSDSLLLSSSQVSMRASATPGRNGVNLKVADFKHSRRLFYTRSREAPNVLWLEQLSLSDPCVVAYAERDKRDYPDQCYLDPGDVFDAYCTLFGTKDGKAELVEAGQVPLKKGDVGEVFPSFSALADIVAHIDGPPL
eukprot:7378505-Prymnesium_polylepis.1